MDIDLSELSSAQQAALNAFIKAITGRIDIEYLFCFALQQHQSTYTHCFAPQKKHLRLQVDLLLVYRDDETRQPHEIQDRANSLGDAAHQYITVALPRAEAFQLFETGDPFLNHVFGNGALLYSSGEILPKRQGYVCYKTRLQHIRQGWHRWFNTSCQFMDAAIYCLMDRNFGMAVFLVHQTIEQACKAVIKVILNMGINTHNLAWMLKLCSGLIPEIATLFPRNNAEEKALFNLLKGSYMDFRYAASFDVREDQAWVLYYRAGALLRAAGDWCNSRIKTMESMTGVEDPL